MRPIRGLVGQELVWTPPALFGQGYTLRAGGVQVATLRWQKAFGTLAAADTAEGSWSFKRAGLLKSRITIRQVGSASDLAVFEPNWSGRGKLEMADGTPFQWDSTLLPSAAWVWHRGDKMPLVQFRSTSNGPKSEGKVTIEPRAASLPEVALLVTLGWYLCVLTLADTTNPSTIVTAKS